MGNVDYNSSPDLARTLRDMQQQIDALKRATQQQVNPLARAIRTTDYVLADNTQNRVPWQAVDYDTAGMWDASVPERLTAPYDGVYIVTSQVIFPADGDGLNNTAWGCRQATICHSAIGNIFMDASDAANGGGVVTSAFTAYTSAATLPFKKGQYSSLELYCQTPGDVSLSILAVFLSMSMTWVGVGSV